VALVGLFTLVGLSDQALTSQRLRTRVIITEALAVSAYLICLEYAYRSIFAELAEQKKSGAKEISATFINIRKVPAALYHRLVDSLAYAA
jgi:hypothetical protein